jgi:uncharacterized protein GlcG (DUF336 family)
MHRIRLKNAKKSQSLMASTKSAGLKSHVKSSLSYKAASEIVAQVLSEARRHHLAPLSVAVLDAGGQLVAYAREDGASLLREEIARGKAFGALGMGVHSRAILENSVQRPAFWQSVFAASGGRVVASPGGVLIVGKKGKIVGAVGVSGDAADEDESAAIHAISAVGLTPNPFARTSKL